VIPGDAVVAADVHKAGVRCASMWRVGEDVTFRYLDVGVPTKVAAGLLTKVTTAVGALIDTFTPELLDMPEPLVRDVRRRVTRRVRDLEV
jgi:hypothetical protein